MMFSIIAFLVTPLANSVLASPTPNLSGREVVKVNAGLNWTIHDMKRDCDDMDTFCSWSFCIETDLGTSSNCTFTIRDGDDKPASQTDNKDGAECGPYTIRTGWDGNFGDGNGFTMLSVIDSSQKLIAWPAYTDEELQNGTTVKPYRQYPVQYLPTR